MKDNSTRSRTSRKPADPTARAEIIKHACGHKLPYDLSKSDTAWWREFIPRTICPACFDKLLVRERKARERKAAKKEGK